MKNKVVDGKILADERIYQPELNIERPKEIFVFVGDRISALDVGEHSEIIDVGCASGSFLHYLRGRFPSAGLAGTDVSDVLVSRAQALIPDGRFFAATLDQEDALPKTRYDVTCSIGVMCYFDDITLPLKNLVSSVKAGGTAIISTMINSDPIDIVARHRRSAPDGQGEWEIGWNIFSQQTYNHTLQSFGDHVSWRWHPVDMPFALEKKEDPMRSWTIETEEKRFQLVNGASQLINMQVLEILVEKSAA
ncbi:MAG: methyltransferase domain-containing protein [Pseudomonadota bacterium]|nr:methyltransferase domain-containing protein [Pseudomonadota bacterium]